MNTKQKPANFIAEQQTGFSLIEMLVATMVVAMSLTAISAVLTYSIKLSDQSLYREVATAKAQEGMDFFKRERVILGWSDFYDIVSGSYCLDQIPDPSQSETNHAFSGLATSCTGYELEVSEAPIGFKREATVNKPDTTTVEISIAVSWPNKDGDDIDVTISQVLKRR